MFPICYVWSLRWRRRRRRRVEIEDRDRRGGGVTGGEKDTRDEAGGSRGQKEGIGNRGGKEYRKEIAHGGGKRKTGGEVERRLQVDGPNFKSGASGGGHRG